MIVPVAIVLCAISIHGAYAQPATTTGVVYAEIDNTGRSADTIRSVSSPQAVRVEIHRTERSTASMHGAMTMSGMLVMKPVPAMTIAAHGKRVFAPGGLHMMLVGLRHPLRVGDRIVLDMTFRYAGRIRTIVPVRAFGDGPR